jgi:O-antigen/teichoic acid export membrane protein
VTQPPDETLEILDAPEAGSKVIRGGALRAAGYVAGVVVGLISTPLMLRHLGVVDFGRFITISSLIFIVGGLTELGLTNVSLREYTLRQPGERRRLIENLLGMRTAVTIAGVALAAVFALVAGYPGVMVTGTLLAGAGLLMTVTQYTLAVPLSASLRLGWVAALDLIRQLLIAALIVGLVLAGAGLLPFYATLAASGLVVLVMTWWLVRGTTPLRPAFDLGQWSSLLKETLPYAAAAALGVVYFRIAVILMSLIASSEETGYFSASFRVIEIVSAIPWMLVTSAFPILVRAADQAELDPARLRNAIQRLFEFAVIAGVWMPLVIWTGAPFAIDLLGGDEFEPAVDSLRILGVAMTGTFLIAVFSLTLLSLGRRRAMIAANAGALAFGTAATLLLEPSMGAEGAALATAMTEVGLGLLYIVLLGRADRRLVPSLRVVGPVALAAALAIAPAVFTDLPSVALALIATAVYFGVLLALRSIPLDVVRALRGGGA